MVSHIANVSVFAINCFVFFSVDTYSCLLLEYHLYHSVLKFNDHPRVQLRISVARVLVSTVVILIQDVGGKREQHLQNLVSTLSF